jgi:hypothetical protein
LTTAVVHTVAWTTADVNLVLVGLALPRIRVLSPVITRPLTSRLSAMDTIRRNPFTAGSIAMMLFVGLATGALFSRVSAHPWGDDVSYGLPAFADGRMWTLITGAFFAVTPLCYVAVIGSFALLTGFAERRLGTYRTVLACVYSHTAGILGAASLVAVGLGDRWSDAIDVGFSAGAMGAAAIATATLPRRRQRFVRAGLLGYCVVALLVLHQLADLEHLVAVLAGLPLGRTFLRFGRPTGPVPGAIADRAQHLLGAHGGGSLSWMTPGPAPATCWTARATSPTACTPASPSPSVTRSALRLGAPAPSPSSLTTAPAPASCRAASPSTRPRCRPLLAGATSRSPRTPSSTSVT